MTQATELITVKQSQSIACIASARQALERARTIDEVVNIRDRAEAIRHYRKISGECHAAQNEAAELKIDAERKGGDILRQMKKHNGDPRSLDVTRLSELGIEKMESHRWQLVASVPEKEYRRHVDSMNESERDLKSASVIRLAQNRRAAAKQKAAEARCTGSQITDSMESLVAGGTKFGTIYADPPWLYGNQATRAATSNHYPGMTVDDICSIPVSQIVADQAHLHLWTTNAFLFEAKRVLDEWGFEYKGVFVWVKPQIGIGNYWRVSHEFMLLGVRGGLTFADRGLSSWLSSPRGKHSAKPQEVRSFIERASPAPRLELFGRGVATGWTVFGNQIPTDILLFAERIA